MHAGVLSSDCYLQQVKLQYLLAFLHLVELQLEMVVLSFSNDDEFAFLLFFCMPWPNGPSCYTSDILPSDTSSLWRRASHRIHNKFRLKSKMTVTYLFLVLRPVFFRMTICRLSSTLTHSADGQKLLDSFLASYA